MNIFRWLSAVLKYFRLVNVIHTYVLYVYFVLVDPRNSNEFNLHKVLACSSVFRVCIMCDTHVRVSTYIFIDVSRLSSIYFFRSSINMIAYCVLFGTNGYTHLSKVLFRRAFSRN